MKISKRNQLTMGVVTLGALSASVLTAHAEEITNRRVEKIPFQTKTQEDPTLPKGTRKVIQAGVEGEKEIVTTQGSTTNSTRKPVDVLVPYDVSGSTSGGEAELDHLEAVAKQGADDTRYMIIGYDDGNSEDGFMTATNGKTEGGSTYLKGAKLSKITKMLSKQQILDFVAKVRQLKPQSNQDGSWPWDKAMRALNLYDPTYMNDDGTTKQAGVTYEALFDQVRDKNKEVGILWFTDEWEPTEKLDTSFFDWAQKNHKDHFLTVVYGGTNSKSYKTLTAAGQKEVLTTAGKDSTALAKEIADKFTSLVTIKTPGKPQTTEKVIKQPVDEIVAIGTKVAEEKADVTRRVEKIPFKTIEEEDDQLPEGTRKVVRPGVEGEKEFITTTIPGTTTEATLRLTSDSTAKNNGDGTYTQTVTVDYDPARDGDVIDPNPRFPDTDKVRRVALGIFGADTAHLTSTSLIGPGGVNYMDPNGKLNEDIKYTKGTYTLKYTFKLADKPVAGRFIGVLAIGKAKAEKIDAFEEVPKTTTPDKTTHSERVIKEPVNEIVHVGVGGQITESKKEPIPFATEIIEDESMMEGEEKVTVEGMTGEKEILTTYKTRKGKKVGDPISTSEHVTKHMRTKIVHRGVKGLVTEKEAVELPFETKIVEDDTLPLGEQKVVQAGVKGHKEITRTWTAQRRLKVGNPTTSEKVTKEPVEEIIHVGTREGVMDTEYEAIPYETRYVDDPTLEAGKEVVVVEGVNGQKAINKFYSISKGKVVSEIDVQTHILRHPTDKVIHRGTGVKPEAPKVEEPKVEAPKVEEPKPEAPKVEEPKVEAPKVEEPKVEKPKVEEPKVEKPKVEEPKPEAPRVEPTKVEKPKELPKVEKPKELPKTGDAGMLANILGMGSIAIGGVSIRRKRRTK